MKTPEVRLATEEDLASILALVRDYERYDVEFAKRYYDVYFRKDQIADKDKVYVATAHRRARRGIDKVPAKPRYWALK